MLFITNVSYERLADVCGEQHRQIGSDNVSSFIDRGIVFEKSSDHNFIYVLNDSKDFLVTDYKVLQSQDAERFVSCMKILYNGKTALYYDTNGRRTFEDYLPALDSNGFINIVSNLFRTIIDVQNNGFLSCQNIDIAFDKIFVSGNNLTVGLVYVPVQKKTFADAVSFESELRAKLIAAIQHYPRIQSPITANLEKNLADGSMSLSVLSGYIRSGRTIQSTENASAQTQQTVSQTKQVLKLTAMNAPVHLELLVDKDEYIIGAKPGAVHGLISFNHAISRIHCKITRTNFGFKVEDMGSANGTYVNRQKLAAHRPIAINDGDILRLANSDFSVTIQ